MKVLHEDENGYGIEDARILDLVLDYYKEKDIPVHFTVTQQEINSLLNNSIDDFFRSIIKYLEGLGLIIDSKHEGDFEITSKGSHYSFVKNFQEKEDKKVLTVKSMLAQIDAVKTAKKSNIISWCAIGISIAAILLSLFKE